MYMLPASGKYFNRISTYRQEEVFRKDVIQQLSKKKQCPVRTVHATVRGVSQIHRYTLYRYKPTWSGNKKLQLYNCACNPTVNTLYMYTYIWIVKLPVYRVRVTLVGHTGTTSYCARGKYR